MSQDSSKQLSNRLCHFLQNTTFKVVIKKKMNKKLQTLTLCKAPLGFFPGSHLADYHQCVFLRKHEKLPLVMIGCGLVGTRFARVPY